MIVQTIKYQIEHGARHSRRVSGAELGYAAAVCIQMIMPNAAEYPRVVKPFRLPGVPLSAQV
eukprot:COSAG02_NODE_28380_length_590_cov_1.922607_1_plen_61_part_10